MIRWFMVVLLLCLAVDAANAQQKEIDKTYNLNIQNKTIRKQNFSGGATLALPKNNKHVQVNVGVGIHAGQMQVKLQNVKGKVVLKGSLDRIDDAVKPIQPKLTAPATTETKTTPTTEVQTGEEQKSK